MPLQVRKEQPRELVQERVFIRRSRAGVRDMLEKHEIRGRSSDGLSDGQRVASGEMPACISCSSNSASVRMATRGVDSGPARSAGSAPVGVGVCNLANAGETGSSSHCGLDASG